MKKKKVVKKKSVVAKKPAAKKSVEKKPEVKKAEIKKAEFKRPAAKKTEKVAPAPKAEIKPTAPSPKIVKPVEPVQQISKKSWTELSRDFPAQVKFLLRTSQAECEQGKAWPFPFAKFMSHLPQEICGEEFAILLMSLDHDTSQIAKICKLDKERVETVLQNGKLNLKESFNKICPEISRKWVSITGGHGRGVESLIEQHLVAKVDRNFQVMLGSVIHKCIGL